LVGGLVSKKKKVKERTGAYHGESQNEKKVREDISTTKTKEENGHKKSNELPRRQWNALKKWPKTKSDEDPKNRTAFRGEVLGEPGGDAGGRQTKNETRKHQAKHRESYANDICQRQEITRRPKQK